MKLLNITPEKYDTYNCFMNNIIVSVCKYFFKNEYLCFLDSFAYQINSINDEYKIHCFTDNFKFIMKNICGISLFNYKRQDIYKCNQFIENEIEINRPVGAIIDSFYLPWSNYYNQLHMSHSILIIGFDSQFYYCTDGFSSQKIESVNKEIIYNKLRKLIKFENNNDVYLNENLVIESLKNTIKNYHDIYSILKYIIINFPNEIKNIHNIEISKSLYHVTNLGWSRKNFSSALDAAEKILCISTFNEIINLINVCESRWIFLKNLLVKSILLSDINIFTKKSIPAIEFISKNEFEVIKIINNL